MSCEWTSDASNMLLLLLTLSSCGVALSAGGGSICPLGFTELHSSCYLFSRQKASYAEANIYCELFRSGLATITSKNEQDALKGYLQKNGETHHYFASGTDLREEGTWTLEKPIREMPYTDWHPSQPNGGSENCFALWEPEYQWHDVGCETEQRFICEKKAKKTKRT